MKKKTSILIALVLCMACLLSACGASSSSYRSDYAEEAYVEAPSAAFETSFTNGFSKGGGGDYAEDEYDMDYPAEEPAEPAPSAEGNEKIQPNDKIIYTGEVRVETTEFDEAVGSIDSMLGKFGAWLESSSVTGSDYYNTSRGYKSNRSASYRIRVPSKNFDAMMNGMSEIGNVPYKQVYTDNVTTAYYDTKAHMESYQLQEQRLKELMEEAETVEDIIRLEERLAEVRYSIEWMQAQLNNWDRSVSYSTINLRIDEVQEYTPETVTKLTFKEEVAMRFHDGMDSFVMLMRDLFLRLVESWSQLILIGVGIFVVVKIIRALRRKRPEKEHKRFGRKNRVVVVERDPVHTDAPMSMADPVAPDQESKKEE